jgi:hypothetical protein
MRQVCHRNTMEGLGPDTCRQVAERGLMKSQVDVGAELRGSAGESPGIP